LPKESKGGGKERKMKVPFWNIADLERQDKDFWEFVIEYDYIGLCETWMNEEKWNLLKGRFPDSHEWIDKSADRIKERRSARGDINKRKD